MPTVTIEHMSCILKEGSNHEDLIEDLEQVLEKHCGKYWSYHFDVSDTPERL